MNPLLATVILILDFVAIVSIFTGLGSDGHKVLGTLLVLLLAIIGRIRYFVIGRNPRNA